jgi:glycosyltransferase involved in cell wall biosynthesis
MFEINLAPAPYSDPWNIPLFDRLVSLSKGQPSVAYYYDFPDNSTFRYRVYNMIQALHASPNHIAAAHFSYKDLNYLERVVDIADILVICRARYNHKLNHAITKARHKGKTVFFDVDDLVFNPEYTHHIINTLAQDTGDKKTWDYWFGYIGRINATLSLCEKIITTNSFLARALQEYSSKPVSVIPNFLNREQLSISEKIYNIKKNNQFKRNQLFTIGYFSGTPSHKKDFSIVEDALCELLQSHKNIELRVVGYVDVLPPLDQFRSQISFFKLQDFINLQRLIGEVEINLVPLQDNIFTNSKSELKYFEAGVVGTVTVASPTFTYKNAIRDKINGFLAEPFEWQKKLQEVIHLSPEDYCYLCEQARTDSLDKFAWYNQIDRIEQVLTNREPT